MYYLNSIIIIITVFIVHLYNSRRRGFIIIINRRFNYSDFTVINVGYVYVYIIYTYEKCNGLRELGEL